MKPTTLLARAFFCLSVCLLVFSSSSIFVAAQRRTPAVRNRANRANRQVAAVVRDIDARNVEQSIRKLVSFGTRNTLS